MRNIILITLISAITFLSCNKKIEPPKEESYFPVESLYKDVTFHEFILDIQKQVSNIQDIQTFRNYIGDGQLSEYETSNIHRIFGYTDKDLFWKDQTLQNNRLLDLNKNYDLKNITESQKRKAVEKAFVTLNLFSQPSTTDTNQMLVADICERIRLNCLASVLAEATIMHMACASMDITVVLGLLCHGAAFTYQITTSNNCNLEAIRCKDSITQ